MARAQYIHYDKVGKQLTAVYGNDADQNELEGIARGLVSATGASISVSHLSLNYPGVPDMLLLTMRTRPGTDGLAAINRLKELTQPELPYTAMTLNTLILECACKRLMSRTDMTFVDGLGPDDPEAFWIDYHAGIKRLDVAALFGEPPHAPLVDALKETLRPLGVHTSEITINLMPGTWSCTHQR